jgi:hypothetical protein
MAWNFLEGVGCYGNETAVKAVGEGSVCVTKLAQRRKLLKKLVCVWCMWLWTSPWSCIPHPPWFLLPLTVSKRYLPWLFRLHRVRARGRGRNSWGSFGAFGESLLFVMELERACRCMTALPGGGPWACRLLRSFFHQLAVTDRRSFSSHLSADADYARPRTATAFIGKPCGLLETVRVRSLQAFRPYELFSKTLTTTFVGVTIA